MDDVGLCWFCWADDEVERLGQLWGFDSFIDTEDEYREEPMYICEEHERELEEDEDA